MTTNFKPCTCGCEVFVMRQTIDGICDFRVGAYGKEEDNSDMHDNLTYRDYWKYYRCEDCGKRAVSVDDNKEEGGE